MALNINGTTGISGVEGSVSAPVLTGTDSNCGISFPSADTIKFSTGGVERMSITDSGVTGTGIGAGKILQVISTEKSDTFSTTSTSLTDVTGMSAALTPSSSSSKILLIGNFSHASTANSSIKMFRDIGGAGYSEIAVGDASGNRLRTFAGSAGYTNIGSATMLSQNAVFLDSPNTTAAGTYKLQMKVGSSGTGYLNRPASTTNSDDLCRSRSSITLIEVAA